MPKDKVVQMVAVYPHNYHSETKPFFITQQQANYWWQIGAAKLGEDPGMRRFSRKRISVLILSKPTTDRLQLGSSLGVSLTWAYLRGEEEAIALVHAYAPVSYQVSA